jgi:S1-C subfamily serine protease
MQDRSQVGRIAKALEGIPVWGCLPGSVAQKAGIRYGDILLTVNGQRTKDIEDYMAARKLRKDGVELTLFRDGREMSVDMAFVKDGFEPDIESLAHQLREAGLFPTEGLQPPSCDPN